MNWFGWVLWHINHCRLFSAKCALYIYIKYVIFYYKIEELICIDDFIIDDFIIETDCE